MGLVSKLLGVDLSKVLDDKAERMFGIGWIVFCTLAGSALVIWAIRGCG